MRRILLLGYTGTIGNALYNELNPDYDIIVKNSKDFDAVNPETIKDVVEYHKPDIIINAVAYSGMDKCEKNPELTFKVNSLFPRYLARLSNENNCLLVHFSTESVFGRGGPFTEDDTPQPMNIYGHTKNLGDYFIKKICKKYYIFRLPLVFGSSPKNNQLIARIISNKDYTPKVANDYYTTPTYNKDIAKEIVRILNEDYDYGLYHITNTGKTSLYDLIKILREDIESVSHKYFSNKDITSDDTGLITIKLPPMRSWRESIKDYKKEISSEEIFK